MSKKPALSERMLSQVEAAVSAEAASAREIWARIDMWALVTIRNALTDLTKRGRIDRHGVEGDYRYSRRPS